METEEKNQFFQINIKAKNSSPQKREKARRKPILGSMAD